MARKKQAGSSKVRGSGKTYPESVEGQFFMVSNHFVDDTSLDGNMLAILCCIVRVAKWISCPSKGGKQVYGAYMGVRKLSQWLRFSVGKVSYTLKKLEKRCIISRHRQSLGNTITELHGLKSIYPVSYPEDATPPGSQALPMRRVK